MVQQSKITKDTLKYYFDRGLELIPINKQHGKRPLHNQWTKRKYTKKEIWNYAKKGYALGWRINSNHCVIDVDPRNNGKEGLRNLEKFLGIDDLSTVFPTIKTGGGGLHFYTSIKDKTKISEMSDMFEGVEFKCNGRQVLIPESIHPSGKFYEFDEWSQLDKPFPKLPKRLIEKLQYKPIESTTEAQISPAELKEILDQLPIENYSTNESWFPMLAASYNVTGGQGFAEFLEWSIGDPHYSSQDKIIKLRWDSLKDETPSKRSLGTLLKELFNHNGNVPESLKAKKDFKDINQELEKFNWEKLIDEINNLPPTTTESEIIKYFKIADRLNDEIKKEQILRKLKYSLDLNMGDLRSMFKAYKKQKEKDDKIFETQESTDYAALVAETALEKKFKNGVFLIHAKNQQFYRYNGKYWEHVPNNIMSQIIYDTAEGILAKTDIDFKISSLLSNAEKVLIAKSATDIDLLRFEGTPPSVVNTLNYEIWINPQTGKIKLERHNPESYLINCLNVEFDKTATCKLYDKTIEEIFSNSKNLEKMIAYHWEILGYLIQPRKNISSCFIFHGRGNNGKSLIADSWCGLLGTNAVLPRALDDFANTSHNNHALASLPGKLLIIDDDVKQNSKLPDGVLKKLSESKQMESNPKGKDTFVFTSVATPLMLTNHWPIVGDVGRGFLRRVNLIPFRKHFTKNEINLNLKYEILENELPGMLNKALRGLIRLRKRGFFAPPQECKDEIMYWLGLTNPVIRFVDTKCIKDNNAKIKFANLFDNYRLWVTTEQGYRNIASAGQFEETLIQLGYMLNNGIVKGLRLK